MLDMNHNRLGLLLPCMHHSSLGCDLDQVSCSKDAVLTTNLSSAPWKNLQEMVAQVMLGFAASGKINCEYYSQ